MKNKVFIAMTAAVAMAALTACGDSSGSSEPSKAEACAQGISEDCLAGTWSLIGLANKNTGDIYPYADYKQAGKQPGCYFGGIILPNGRKGFTVYKNGNQVERYLAITVAR